MLADFPGMLPVSDDCAWTKLLSFLYVGYCCYRIFLKMHYRSLFLILQIICIPVISHEHTST